MKPWTRSRRTVTGALAAVAIAPLVAVAGTSAVAAPPEDSGHYTLTILHNNDGESALLNAPGQPDFGGIARFVTLVDELRTKATIGAPAQAGRRGAIVLSSGDNFLAGPEFTASLRKGVPFYDSLAMAAIGYDASAIGNHEFDFGPDLLADFITGIGPDRPPFVSANLDFTAEPRLQELVDDGTIVDSTVVKLRGASIGIVGATTPLLPAISSPRNVVVDPDVAGIVQEQVDALTAEGIDKIILMTHLQSITNDQALVPMLHDVDVAIAGGGDELLANDGDLLVPGDVRTIDPATGQPFPYPVPALDADGEMVPIITTAGDYKYVGQLVVTFDRDGEVVSIGEESSPIRVSGVAPDAVAPDPQVQADIVEPVQAFVANLANNVIAQSEVALEGRRDPGVRTQETNLGSLVADSLLYTGRQKAAEFGVVPPDVALQNGGGIRNNSLIPAGPLTELTTFDIAPFSNFVSVVPDVPRSQFKEILENVVSRAPVADGRFAQVAGFSFTYDSAQTAQVVDNDGNVLTPGSRVVDVVLDDGTVIVQGGAVVAGPGVAIATNDFSARGGDQYPFRGLPFTSVGTTYQQSLFDYLTQDAGLGGLVSAAQYPEGGSGRIVRLG